MNNRLLVLLALLSFSSCGLQQVAHTRPIKANGDGTGTRVRTAAGIPNQFNIDGGTQAGQNLFHSFEKFGLDRNQIANFMSNSEIQNILGRVNGGQASNIDGLLRVTGSSANLYLMNPAGILFGPNARLDLRGSFSATTATGIQIDDYWFKAFGSNNYEQLIGNPQAYAFAGDELGTVVNAGSLEVDAGQSVTLLGGIAINTGTITAEGGDITIAAVPEEQVVRITPEGALLSLDLPMQLKESLLADAGTFEPLDFPSLLTGGGYDSATGVTVADGKVILTGSETVIPDEGGTAIASGTLDASTTAGGEVGGDIKVLGELVGVVSADIDVSGDGGGGEVLMGGGFQGNGVVPNAERTYVSSDTTIAADALTDGHGGRVIAWADKSTEFFGNISARGGDNSGNGGFVEISGEDNLVFDGTVDVGATIGLDGTILFDPKDIMIVKDSEARNNQQLDANVPNNGQLEGQIFQADGPGSVFKIGTTKLGGITGNVILQATNDISLNTDLTFKRGENGSLGTIRFIANADGIDGGSFRMGSGRTIETDGRSIEISGDTISTGTIDTSFSDSGSNEGGDIILRANGDIRAQGNITTIDIEQSGLDRSTKESSVAIESRRGSVRINGFVASNANIEIQAKDTIQILGSGDAQIYNNQANVSDFSIFGGSISDFLKSKGVSVPVGSKVDVRTINGEGIPSSIIVDPVDNPSSPVSISLLFGDRSNEITNSSFPIFDRDGNNTGTGRIVVRGGSDTFYREGLGFDRIIDNGDDFVVQTSPGVFESINSNNVKFPDPKSGEDSPVIFLNAFNFRTFDGRFPSAGSGTVGASVIANVTGNNQNFASVTSNILLPSAVPTNLDLLEDILVECDSSGDGGDICRELFVESLLEFSAVEDTSN